MTWPNVIRIDHEYRPQLTLDTDKVKRLVLDAYQTPMIAELAPMMFQHWRSDVRIWSPTQAAG